MRNGPLHVASVLLLVGLSACAAPPAEETPADLTANQASRVTLTSRGGAGEGVRLLDGAVVPAGSAADLTFTQTMVLSLRSPTPDSICPKGTFAAWADIPADVEGCPAAPAGWTQIVYLDAAAIHTLAESRSAGRGLLVRDRDHRALFRLRVVGDSYSAEAGASVVFELARVP